MAPKKDKKPKTTDADVYQVEDVLDKRTGVCFRLISGCLVQPLLVCRKPGRSSTRSSGRAIQLKSRHGALCSRVLIGRGGLSVSSITTCVQRREPAENCICVDLIAAFEKKHAAKGKPGKKTQAEDAVDSDQKEDETVVAAAAAAAATASEEDECGEASVKTAKKKKAPATPSKSPSVAGKSSAVPAPSYATKAGKLGTVRLILLLSSSSYSFFLLGDRRMGARRGKDHVCAEKQKELSPCQDPVDKRTDNRGDNRRRPRQGAAEAHKVL